MKTFIAIFILLTSLNAYSADMSFQGLLGFQNGAANVGADIDFQVKRAHSVGAYFILGTEKLTANRRQFWSLGGDVKVFFGPDEWKLYLAPGVGIASFDLASGDSEMTFGSMLKVGSLLEVAFDMYLGLELMYYVNWFSDQAPGAFIMTNAAFRINF